MQNTGGAGKHSRSSFGGLCAAVVLLLAASVLAVVVSYALLIGSRTADETGYGSYQYHVALISEDTDSSFWQDIRRGAEEAGRSYGVYVEQVGADLVERLSLEDAMDMAIYENVDGILLRPSGTGNLRSAIDKAVEHGIPVITMQADVPDSDRQGFVGLNDYFLGMEYGKRVLKIADDDARLAAVLFPGAAFNTVSRRWFRLGLENTVNREGLHFDYQIIWDDRGLNNAEDVLHDMTEGNTEQPDMILCLDEVITQSTCRMLRDRGLSGEIRVIGSNVSEEILKGIEDGIIDSTITVDPAVIGKKSVDALMTYKKYHMVSYYTEVDTMLLDRDSAADYGKESGDGAT